MSFPTLGQPDTGDTAWMLASSALVLLMTPGLAFFYGGMVRARSVLNMLMMSISAMGVVTVLWVLYGYSMAFGNDTDNVVGDPTEYWGLKGLIGGNSVAADAGKGVAATNIPLAGTLPMTVFVAFQLMFAIITVALISGAVSDRLKFSAWLVFAGLWATFVYFPVAHWVFCVRRCSRLSTAAGSPTSCTRSTSPAGTAVHINSGTAGLVPGDRPGQAQRLAHHAVPPAQCAVRDARRGLAVVRLVRVQRRFGHQRQRRRRVDVHDHHDRHGHGHALLAAH